MKKRLAVLGAGPAGLGLAWSVLRRYPGHFEVVIIEKEETAGGIAGGFTACGLNFDYGSHRLHPENDGAVFQDLQKMLGEELQKRRRYGRIRILGRFVGFPLTVADMVSQLPPDFLLGVAGDTVKKVLRLKRHPAAAPSYAGMLLQSLGPTICRHFYFPYAEKLWGLKPEELSVMQAKKRVASDNIFKIAKKILSAAVRRGKTGSFFYYPAGGFGRISEEYARAIEKAGGRVQTGSRVEKIRRTENNRFIIETGNPDFFPQEYDMVFSTLPVTELVKIFTPVPPAVQAAAAGLTYRGMVFHYLILRTNQFTPYDAHYFPEKRYIFSRVSEPKNYAGRQDPPGLTGICSEIPCRPGDEIWNLSCEEISDRVLAGLKEAGLPVGVPVEGCLVKRLPAVYPVYDLQFASRWAVVEKYFDKIPNFVTFGRQGLFIHDNIHHALETAYQAAECLEENLVWNKSRWKQIREEYKKRVVVD